MVKTKYKFGLDQIIKRSRPKLKLVKTKFLSDGRIVPKKGWKRTKERLGGVQFEGGEGWENAKLAFGAQNKETGLVPAQKRPSTLWIRIRGAAVFVEEVK